MKRANRSGWRVSLATWALSAAVVSGGISLAFAADAPVTTAPAASQPNRAALEAFQKARDLYRQERYVDAETENNRALQLDPTLTDAQLLRKILLAKLADSSATGSGSTVASDNSATAPSNTLRLLTMQQISMIRLQELSDKDMQIRGRVPRKTLDAYWNQYVKAAPGADLSQAAYNAFVNPNNLAAQVRAIKLANAPELSETVEINSDPATLVPFRTLIHPFVLQNCATAACHGGDRAGNFRLVRPAGAVNDQVIYTNFYIMSKYVTRDGEKVVNRDQTANSLFLQYSLPKTVAHFPHPGRVELRRFPSENALEYRTMTDWVRSLAYPRPNYGIVYEIPGQTAAPASAPAPAPTTRPANRPAAPKATH